MGFLGLIILISILLLATQSSRLRQVGAGGRPPGLGMGHSAAGQRYGTTPHVDLGSAIGAADDDITTFGDELRDLDLAVVGIDLDQATQQDYQRALDAYEASKVSLAQVRSSDQLQHVTEILEDGRYWIACVQARVAGQPLPVKRPPCFFNPAHGPSVRNVTWAPMGGSAREIPACAADAERVAAGADPSVRMVMSGPARVPYWQDPAYGAYTQGYYRNWQADPAVRGLAVGTAAVVGLSLLPGLLHGLDHHGFDFDF